jgi:hypothetical protein
MANVGLRYHAMYVYMCEYMSCVQVHYMHVSTVRNPARLAGFRTAAPGRNPACTWPESGLHLA